MQKECKSMILSFAQLLALTEDEQTTLLKIDVKNGAQGCEFLFYTGHSHMAERVLNKRRNSWRNLILNKVSKQLFLDCSWTMTNTHVYNKLLSFGHFWLTKKKVHVHLFVYFLWLLWGAAEDGMEAIVSMGFGIWHMFSKRDKLDHWKMSQE